MDAESRLSSIEHTFPRCARPLRPLLNAFFCRRRIHLFILAPRFSGSTLLAELVANSPSVTALPVEGQWLPEAVGVLGRPDRWDDRATIDWAAACRAFERHWSPFAPIRLEKSPPHLLRADQLAHAFPSATFLVLMRDPYAVVEGELRRNQQPDAAAAASFWIRCAARQRQTLERWPGRSLLVRYEDFTTDPQKFRLRLLSFLPVLGNIELAVRGESRNVRGVTLREIVNLNAEKIARLDDSQRVAVAGVLAQHEDLCRYFGYDPSVPG
jgi:hypothetical protein